MPSSTSSSRPGPIVWAACFLLGFALITAVGETLPPGMRDELYLWQRTTRLDDTWQPQGRFGHENLYRGNEFLPAMREADVLILGNSRTLFAFRHAALADFERRTGLRAFNLGLTGESGTFALQIVQRHELRPAILLINADQFFSPGISPVARLLVGKTEKPKEDWRDHREALEDAMARRARGWIRPWIPRWHGLLPSSGIPRSVYRSLSDGTCYMAGFDAIETRFELSRRAEVTSHGPADETTELSPKSLAMIDKLGADMAANGTQIILTYVPHRSQGEGHHRQSVLAAARLGVPLVEPRLEGLQTFDHSHLNGESARRFGAAFFALFEELEVIRALIDASSHIVPEKTDKTQNETKQAFDPK